MIEKAHPLEIAADERACLHIGGAFLRRRLLWLHSAAFLRLFLIFFSSLLLLVSSDLMQGERLGVDGGEAARPALVVPSWRRWDLAEGQSHSLVAPDVKMLGLFRKIRLN